jgi:phospholipid/cholesterol/gamma-HCH transport system permease protein
MLNQFYQSISQIGYATIHFVWQLGFAMRFLGNIIWYSRKTWTKPILLNKNIYFFGVLSLLIITVSGFFLGMVLGLQSYTFLARFGSPNTLGAMVAIALLRELGPVLSALLFAGRAGSAMTASIGLMKATEQLDAMSAMAVNPIAQVIAPRFWAGIISMPILAALFSVAGIWGSYLVGVVMIGLDQGMFWSQILVNVDWYDDVLNGLIKSAVFGICITAIAVLKGYNAKPTAEGVAHATTQTVVMSALSILALDFILTAFMF